MIDEKKIANAARAYCKATYGSLIEDPMIEEGFRQGAKWAQEEFVKSLWHDASKEPVKGKKLLGHDVDGYSIYCWIDQEVTWKEFVYNTVLQKWCYISDVLPKKGGKE